MNDSLLRLRSSRRCRSRTSGRTRWARTGAASLPLLRAGLHPNAEPGDDDHWDDGTTLTETTDALEAVGEHPDNQTLQQERLLVAAYQRLNHDRTTPRNVYVPTELRPWSARFLLQN